MEITTEIAATAARSVSREHTDPALKPARKALEAELERRFEAGECFDFIRHSGFHRDLRDGYVVEVRPGGERALVRYRTMTCADDGLGRTGWGTVRCVIARSPE